MIDDKGPNIFSLLNNTDNSKELMNLIEHKQEIIAPIVKGDNSLRLRPPLLLLGKGDVNKDVDHFRADGEEDAAIVGVVLGVGGQVQLGNDVKEEDFLEVAGDEQPVQCADQAGHLGHQLLDDLAEGLHQGVVVDAGQVELHLPVESGHAQLVGQLLLPLGQQLFPPLLLRVQLVVDLVKEDVEGH
jgi:hypothetical protein